MEQLGDSAQKEATEPFLIDFFTEEEHFEDWLEDLEPLPIPRGSDWSSTLERKLAASFSSPTSPLFMICSFGFIALLESPDTSSVFDLNQGNKDATSGLYLAARWGHVKVAQKLLDLGANVDASGYQYGNALQAACCGGYQDIVKSLLDRGASSLAKKAEFSSPLEAALANDQDHVSQALLDAEFQFVTQKQFDDALSTANFKGNVVIVEQLLDGKAGNFTPETHHDPLQVALFGGRGDKTSEKAATGL